MENYLSYLNKYGQKDNPSQRVDRIADANGNRGLHLCFNCNEDFIKEISDLAVKKMSKSE